MINNKPETKENFIKAFQVMLKDELYQTELIDLIEQENKALESIHRNGIDSESKNS